MCLYTNGELTEKSEWKILHMQKDAKIYINVLYIRDAIKCALHSPAAQVTASE